MDGKELLQELLRRYPDQRVSADTKQKLAAPRHLYTSGHPLFFEELERLVGAENIATK